MTDVDVVHDHTLTGPLYRHAPAGKPVVTTAHGPFDATLRPVYRAMRGVAVVAISHPTHIGSMRSADIEELKSMGGR